jgi:hypothetical protein
MREYFNLGNGRAVQSVRGWIMRIGGHFDKGRGVWIVPMELKERARRIVKTGGPGESFTSIPIIDAPGEWWYEAVRSPGWSPDDPRPVGPPELVLMCQRALAMIEDDLKIGRWNDDMAQYFAAVEYELQQSGFGVRGLSEAYGRLLERSKTQIKEGATRTWK